MLWTSNIESWQMGRHRGGRSQLASVHQQLPLLCDQSGSFPISVTSVDDCKVTVARCWFILQSKLLLNSTESIGVVATMGVGHELGGLCGWCCLYDNWYVCGLSSVHVHPQQSQLIPQTLLGQCQCPSLSSDCIQHG